MDAEKAHHFVTKMLLWLNKFGLFGIVKQLLIGQLKNQKQQVAGLTFRNKLGLAAGFDKNAEYLEVMDKLGFGFVEIGTITPKPQSGNDKPRLFRLKRDHALLNRMGFNNEGMDTAVKRLSGFRAKFPKTDLIVGGNIGKNKVTPNENAHEDYAKCYECLYTYVDYFVVNVSSPNTPNLRELQDKDALKTIFEAIRKVDEKMKNKVPKPLFVKISPDNSFSQIDDILDLVEAYGLAGIVATNTTISRDNLLTNSLEVETLGAGGLSGKPVKKRSTEVVRYIRSKNNSIIIIGVGGIETATDANEKLNAGANLIQVYSGFIYAGPKIISEIVNGVK